MPTTPDHHLARLAANKPASSAGAHWWHLHHASIDLWLDAKLRERTHAHPAPPALSGGLRAEDGPQYSDGA